MDLEKRAAVEIEVRAGDSGARKVGGYAVVYNSEADIAGMFRERIMPGAFARSLAGDVRALFGHDRNIILGRTKSGTLRLRDDAKGLGFDLDLPDTQAGRDLATSLERGDIDGMSFGFRVTRQEWDESGDVPLRKVIEADLFEISVVGEPAYDSTSVALRSLNEARKDKPAHPAHKRISERQAQTEQVARGIR